MKNNLFLLFTGLLMSVFYGQESFLVVNQDSISYAAFEEQYAANIASEGKSKAAETYIEFALLKQEALKTGIDTTARFKNQLQHNTTAIRDKYLYDSGVTERLTDEIWKRMQTDRKAEIYAIGIPNSYDDNHRSEREKLVKELHQHVCQKQPATASVKEFQDKNTVKTLWLRPFAISSEFEKAAYTINSGCTEIISAENGKFFVNVLDTRPSAGIVMLEYIYNKDKNKVIQALDSVKAGKNWSDMKNKFGAYEGMNGYFNKPRFEADLPEPFYAQIQTMQGQKYSEPFEANDGWYIIHLINHEKFTDKNNWQDWIQERIMQTDYALEYVQHSEKTALGKVEISEDPQAFQEVLDLAGKDFFKKSDSLTIHSNETIWRIRNQVFTQNDLVKELNLSRQYLGADTDFEKFAEDMKPQFKKQFILNAYVQNLENYEPEYASEFNLMKEAMILNYYIDNEVYATANDTEAKQTYLQANADRYTWPERFDMEVYRYRTEEQGNEINKMLKKNASAAEIRKKFEGQKEDSGLISVVVTEGKFFRGDGYLPADFNPKKKIQSAKMFNQNVIIRMKKILPPESKTVDEAGNQLLEDYKSWLYAQNIQNLKKHATIKVPAAFKQ